MNTIRVGDWSVREDVDSKGKQPTAFDLLTKLLPLVLVAVAQFEQQESRYWALIGFAGFTFLSGYYLSIQTAVRRQLGKLHDKKLAQRMFPEFKKYVAGFGAFVDTGRDDGLHNVLLREVCHSNSSEFQRFSLPEIRLFNGFWTHLNSRVSQQSATVQGLQQTATEFSHLVSSYNNNCVMPIFHYLPKDQRESFSSEAKSSLNSFQQRFALFLDSYSGFVRELENFKTRPDFPYYGFARPKPL